MAYVRPRIRVRENNRRAVRGGIPDAESGRTVFQATRTEAFKVDVDFTDILDGATITAAVTSDGVTATAAVASGVVTLSISAIGNLGDVDLAVTFSDGRVQEEFLRFRDPFSIASDDYGAARIPA
jgi:hypothetical protein